ncbi:poly(ADP-ribose) glycohydrolase-like, partial [Brachionus plicatilis]
IYYKHFIFSWYAKSHHKEVNEVKIEKIKCLLHYFDRIINKDEKEIGNITFCRFSHDFDIQTIGNSENKIRFPSISNEKSIEECNGKLQVDFANKYIGGGVLNSGCVQEEIRFLMCPELIVSMLFMEPMANNECIIIRGSEQFSTYSGYAWSFKWSGNFEDNIQKDKCGRKMTDVLAIDALYYQDSKIQYKKKFIDREITKAYIGFSSGAKQMPIASGNWGCGVFNGDIQLKFIIQLIAASQAERDLHYCTFHDEKIKNILNEMIDVLKSKNFTVSSLYKCLIQFCSQDQKSLREFIKKQ